MPEAGGFALLEDSPFCDGASPRETVDVDATLLTGLGTEGEFIDALQRVYEARIENAVEFALTRRVLLLRAKSGVGLDIALGSLPFEESVVD
ncbi:MAG: hypothetical protein ACRD2A_06005 [Vicinamibacterales bacterium]